MMVSRFEDSGILQIYENFGRCSWNISCGVGVVRAVWAAYTCIQTRSLRQNTQKWQSSSGIAHDSLMKKRREKPAIMFG